METKLCVLTANHKHVVASRNILVYNFAIESSTLHVEQLATGNCMLQESSRITLVEQRAQ